LIYLYHSAARIACQGFFENPEGFGKNTCRAMPLLNRFPAALRRISAAAAPLPGNLKIRSRLRLPRKRFIGADQSAPASQQEIQKSRAAAAKSARVSLAEPRAKTLRLDKPWINSIISHNSLKR
jgi:hypothetical protein